MVTRRPVPKIPMQKIVAVVAAFTIVTGLLVWISLLLDANWLMTVPFVGALPVGWYFFTTGQCPECGQPLTTCREVVGVSTTYKILSRCGHCDIDWDTGLLGDSRHDD